ncbi:MAG: hypothetical protein U0166_27690 [Acidobacteriota bacterium]
MPQVRSVVERTTEPRGVPGSLSSTVRRAILATLAIMPLGSAVARAECMAIQPFVVPSDTELVPPNPRLILFAPRVIGGRALPIEVEDAAGHALAFHQERVSRADAYDAYAITVTARAGQRFTVSAGSARPAWSASYRVEASWKKPSPPPWDCKVTSSAYAWACSFERCRILSLPEYAPAYRVEWTPAGGAEPVRSLVVPSSAAWFFSPKEPRRGGRDELKLGHLNCTGWNFRWDDDAVTVRLVALHADGSEDAPSPPLDIVAPGHVQEGRIVRDTPDLLGSPQAAWDSLLSAMRSGRVDAVRHVCTDKGWRDLERAVGRDPARLTAAAEGWGDTPLRWLPNETHSAAARWGPEIQEHAFRFTELDGEWRLDAYSPGD